MCMVCVGVRHDSSIASVPPRDETQTTPDKVELGSQTPKNRKNRCLGRHLTGEIKH